MSTLPAALRLGPGTEARTEAPAPLYPPHTRAQVVPPLLHPARERTQRNTERAGAPRSAPAKMAAARRGPDGTGPGTSRRAPSLTAPRSLGPLAEGGGGWWGATPFRAESRKCTSTWWGGGHRAVRGWGGRVAQWSWPPVPVHVACAASETDPLVECPIPACFRELMCHLTRLDSAGSRL